MQTSSLTSSCPVQFSLITKEAVRLLDEYLYRHIRNIPHPMRYNIINKHNTKNLQCFINLYKKDFLDKYEKEASNNLSDFTLLSKLYETLLSIIRGIEENFISKEDFDIRCKLLAGVVPMAINDIQKYSDDSPINFHLFRCIYELIFNKLELTVSQREILNHRFGYSDKYEKVTPKEIAEKLRLTCEAVHAKKNTLERKINDEIIKFRVLTPYYSYKSKYLINAEIIKITPDIFECIRRDEKAEEMTPCFIAKVLSVIYNYKLMVTNFGDSEKYWLINRGTIETNKIIRFGDQYMERN